MSDRGHRPERARTEPAGPMRSPRAMTFVVRLSENETGAVVGVVERLRTGRKERLDGIEAISRVIAAMWSADPADDRDGPKAEGSLPSTGPL